MLVPFGAVVAVDAVLAVTQQRMSDMGKVSADLVRAARD